MSSAMVTSIALLVAAQAGAGGEAVKASQARGWLAPTRVRLDFRDRTLAEIVEGINAQGPAMLAIRPLSRGRSREAEPVPPPPRYSLSEPGPVTFWEAVERVGRTTETRPVTGNVRGPDPGIVLYAASADRGFACNEGAFRVSLRRVVYVSRFRFAHRAIGEPDPEPPKPDGSSRRPVVSAHLLVTAEPRLKVHGPVELILREAIDDRGRSLIPSVPWRRSLRNPPSRSGFPNQESIAIPLAVPNDPGRRIKRLAGSVSVEVSESTNRQPVATAEIGFDFRDVPLP
jgi:hypothetical protein